MDKSTKDIKGRLIVIYTSAYQIHDTDDKGYSCRDEYLLVNSVGYYEFDEPYGATHRKNGRKDYYLSYNHAGNVKVRVKQKNYEIGAGTVFIYRPFEEQYYGQANKEPIASYWVHFTGYGLLELLEKAGLGEENIFVTGTNDEIPELFEKLIIEVFEKQSSFEFLSALLLQQIIFSITRRISSNNQKVISAKQLRINETINHIHRNYEKNISIVELANIAGFSPSRYSGIFRELFNVSPKQYLIKYRLQKAKELMRHTNLTIKQISNLAGFEDQLYFSRLFKKYEKLSPLEYKKKLKT